MEHFLLLHCLHNWFILLLLFIYPLRVANKNKPKNIQMKIFRTHHTTGGSHTYTKCHGIWTQQRAHEKRQLNCNLNWLIHRKITFIYGHSLMTSPRSTRAYFFSFRSNAVSLWSTDQNGHKSNGNMFYFFPRVI